MSDCTHPAAVALPSPPRASYLLLYCEDCRLTLRDPLEGGPMETELSQLSPQEPFRFQLAPYS